MIKNGDIISIIRETLNFIDERLVEHGERVAYIMMQMLRCEGTMSEEDIALNCLLGVVHDIGAFKTEEIEKLIEFESDAHFEHSIYGYLFLKYLSPLGAPSDAILHHHTDFSDLDAAECKNKDAAALIHLADKFDIILLQFNTLDDTILEKIFTKLRKSANIRFSGDLIDLLEKANNQFDIVGHLRDKTFSSELSGVFLHLPMNADIAESYLKMLICSIDFRSPVTVLHTFTTTIIAETLAELSGMSETEIEKIHFGALLHDIGKIKTPLEILEKQGKLSSDEIVIMKQHVSDSRLILSKYISPEIVNIATRHHEKLNGSGYPDGLVESDLTLSEKIVAVADIMSALLTKRSYKEAFPLSETVATIEKMGTHGYLDPEIVALVVANANKIADTASEASREYIEIYQKISDEYSRLNQE